MTEQEILFWGILLGSTIPLCCFLLYAVRVSFDVKTIDEFFLAKRAMSGRSLAMTLGASWFSIGNVTLSLIIMGFFFGWMNIWTAFTWFIGFLILFAHAKRIRTMCDESGELSINSFLKKRLSRLTGYAAATLIIIIAISLLALELIVAMSVFSLVTPAPEGDIFGLIIGLAMAVVITLYATMGGLTAVVKTDVWQFYLILISLACILIGMFVWSMGPDMSDEIAHSVRFQYDIVSTFDNLFGGPWLFADSGVWMFVLGLVCLQFFLIVGDMGSWQRILAVDAEQARASRNTWSSIWIVGVVSALAWAIIAGAGMMFSPVFNESLQAENIGGFAAYDSLFVRDIISTIAGITHPVLTWFLAGSLVLLIVAGLMAAMLSTSDSYLLVALQSLSSDILEKHRQSDRLAEDVDYESGRRGTPGDKYRPCPTDTASVSFSRRWMWACSTMAFMLAVVILAMGWGFLEIALLVLGSQVAIAPVAVLAMRQDIDVSRYGREATVALISGASLAFAFGFFSMLKLDPNVHPYTGFVPPIIALGVSYMVLTLALLLKDGPRASLMMFACMFGVYGFRKGHSND